MEESIEIPGFGYVDKRYAGQLLRGQANSFRSYATAIMNANPNVEVALYQLMAFLCEREAARIEEEMKNGKQA